MYSGIAMIKMHIIVSIIASMGGERVFRSFSETSIDARRQDGLCNDLLVASATESTLRTAHDIQRTLCLLPFDAISLSQANLHHG